MPSAQYHDAAKTAVLLIDDRGLRWACGADDPRLKEVDIDDYDGPEATVAAFDAPAPADPSVAAVMAPHCLNEPIFRRRTAA